MPGVITPCFDLLIFYAQIEKMNSIPISHLEILENAFLKENIILVSIIVKDVYKSKKITECFLFCFVVRYSTGAQHWLIILSNTFIQTLLTLKFGEVFGFEWGISRMVKRYML